MIKRWKAWKWGILGMGIVIFFALTLRLFNLTILPVFADEAIYIRWSQVMANEPTLRFLPLSDGKQPLFMWGLMTFVHRLSDPLFAGRLLSVATGMGSLIGVFALSKLLFRSRTVSLIASSIYAISPFSVFFDRMALVDSMLTMFGIWILFFGVLTAKFVRLDTAMITGFALGFASLTKSSAVFFAMLLPATLVYTKSKREFLKTLLLFMASFAIAFGMYSIQRLGPNFHLLSARTKDYVFGFDRLLTNPMDPFIYNFPTAWRWIWEMGPSVILVLGLGGALFNFKKYTREVFILFSWFLIPIAIQALIGKTFTARYILFSIPYFFILGASVFLIKTRIVKNLAIFALLIFIAHSLWFDYLLTTDPLKAPLPRRERSGYLEEWTSGIGIKEAADYIKKEHDKNPNIKIVVGTEGYFGTLPDGLTIYLEKVPNVIVIGVGLAINELPQSLKESKEAGNKTYLLINNSRLKAPSEKLGLVQISSYAKGLREPGTREYLINGPQEFLYLFEVKDATIRTHKPD